MIVRIALLHEDGGRPLPRHRVISLQPDILGDLSITEAYIHALRRTVRSAMLHDSERVGHTLVPSLMDARVVWCKEDRMIIKGIEADELTRKQTAQAWLVDVIGPGLR